VDKSLLVGSPAGTKNLLVVVGDPNSPEFDPNADVASMDLALDVSTLYQNQGPWAVSPPYLLGRSQTDSIASSGCGLVSLVMALNSAGVATDPIQLNQQLTASPNGYVGTDSINWGPATAIAAFSANQPTVQWHPSNVSDDQGLRDLITKYAAPVIVSVTNPTTGHQHFVLVTGLDGDTFYINDPGYAGRTTLDSYNDSFQARGYVSDPQSDLSQFYLATSSLSPALTLSVEDSAGSVTGVPPGASGAVTQIPNSIYFLDGPVEDLTGQNPGDTTTQFVYMSRPEDGTYKVEASGAGAYTLAVSGVSPVGQPTQASVVWGLASSNSPGKVTIDLAGGAATVVGSSFSNLSAPTITSGTASATISGTLNSNASGQNVPAGETVQVTLNGVTETATLDGNDDFETTFDTSALTVANSPYTIAFSYAGDANFSSATGGSTLTVNPVPTPSFSNLSAPTITYGTAWTAIAGNLNGNAGGQVVPAGETVEVTLNGVTQAAILDSSDNFFTTFGTSTLGVAGSPYTISFSYPGDSAFASATASSALTVQQATPSFAHLSTPTILAGTASTTISGTLGANANGQIVPAGEAVQVTLNGVTQNATLDGNDNFSTTFDTSTLTTANSPYTIAFSYAGDGNFTTAVDSSAFTVVQMGTPSFSNLSAPTIIVGAASTTISGILNSNVAGQMVPAGEAVQVTLNGVTQRATLDSNDDFSTTFDTSTLGVPGSPYTIAFSYAGDGNFNPASDSSNLTVRQASPSFSGLSTPTITVGTASIAISGTLDANASGQIVPAGETVQVTLNGITQNATLDANDNFSTTFDTSALNVAGSPYTIGLSYAGDATFTPATGSGTLTVVSAIRPGFDSTTFLPNDDGTYPANGPESATPPGTPVAQPLGFDVNFYGLTFDQVYINNNGNVTFDAPQSDFTPFDLTSTSREIIAPFFADVDTRFAGSPVRFGAGTIDGHPALGVTWENVDYFYSDPSHSNRDSFQLVLIDRSDIKPGDFEFEFNYDKIQWEAGEASGSDANGLGSNTTTLASPALSNARLSGPLEPTTLASPGDVLRAARLRDARRLPRLQHHNRTDPQQPQ
jgi:hypothetical protein